MTDFSFAVTKNAPAVTRKGGGNRRGRARTNPYREAVEHSYNQNFEATDEWYEFEVDLNSETGETDLKRELDRIRAAGQLSPQIGTSIRVDRENGRVCFRGTDYKPRQRKGKVEADEADETADVPTEGPELGEDEYFGPGPA